MRWSFICTLILLCGCGQAFEANDSAFSGGVKSVAPERTAGANVLLVDNSDSTRGAAAVRKIIYNAEINLVVKDFAAIESEIPAIVRKSGGFLADVSIDRTQGAQRSGRWQARIPVDRFEAFLDSVSELGIPENRRQTAQDVTEEFVDLDARIANQKRLEERIVKLLDSSSDEIKDVIEVERELGRVRGEIEQFEGRLRFLTDRTELTTVTIMAREQRDYVPPAAPSFTGRIEDAWTNSLLELKNFGADVAVAAVYAAPWLLLVLIALSLPTFFVWRLARKSKAARAA